MPDHVWANGDEFYRFDTLDPTDLESQVIYAGSVKDVDGNRVTDAKVTISLPVVTPRGEKIVSFNSYSNFVGRYRSFAVGSVILSLEEIEVVVDPATVSVTVSKPGYAVVRALNRSKMDQTTGVIEIDFTLAPDTEKE